MPLCVLLLHPVVTIIIQHNIAKTAKPYVFIIQIIYQALYSPNIRCGPTKKASTDIRQQTQPRRKNFILFIEMTNCPKSIKYFKIMNKCSCNFGG
jgi:hypothetical protein